MNPASIDAMSWEMAEVYGAITDQIVINLAHYFPYLNAGKHPPKSMFDYQAAMLAQMGKVNAQTMQIIRNNLSDADRALSASLETAIAEAIKDSEPALYRGAKAGIFKPPTKPVLSANQTRAFGLYYKQAADKLNLVNTVMLESTQSAYMQTVSNVISEYEILERINRTQIALDVAAGETITGVSSWNTAVRHATQRMKDGGITGFIDHAGRHWDAETYVAMDVRTTTFNAGRAAVWETNEDFGNDLYIVSYHNGARPLCYDWQNKVISATNNSRDVADLDGNVVHVYAQNETTYGEPAGLFGINCKHYPTPFVPGVSAVRGQVQDKAENDKQYAESQKQRALERNLREQKRDLEMMKAQNAPEDIIRAQREKVRAASKEIDDFCDETGRVRRRNREAVYTKRDFPSGNYDPSQFAREQQKRFDDYWKNGGTQSGFTFGQLVPNVPIVPPTPKEFKTEKDFDDEISRIRAERSAAFDSDNYDKATTDRQLQEILELEDRKKAFVEMKEKAALDASIITTRPENEPLVLQQFRRFDVEKRTDAQMLAQVNPNYKEGTRKWTYNCQRTVTAQELVYRGYDVTAQPYNPKDPIGDTMWNAWKKPHVDNVTIPTKKSFVSTVEESFSRWGDGSRAIIRVKWNAAHGNGGHFIFARNVNGGIIYTDPQSGKVLNIAETIEHTTQGRNHMWIMRVDNKEVNENVLYAVRNRGD